MNSHDYLRLISEKSKGILDKTLMENGFHGQCYYHASCLIELQVFVIDQKEKDLLKIVATQIESSAFLCSLGLYRQSFSTLRLALEMGLATLYFSLNKLSHFEWEAGRADIVWSQLIDVDNGVLSSRVKGVFLDDDFDIVAINRQAKNTYRALSEFVHGNQSTFLPERLFIEYDVELVRKFEELEKKCCDVLFLSFFIRYHKDISHDARESIRDIFNDFFHLEYIRAYFGGPKDI